MEALQKKFMMKEFTLDGLDCANCAMKIEMAVKDIAGVRSSSVNFVTKTLYLEVEEQHIDKVIINAKEKVKKLEPHIQVKEKVNDLKKSSSNVLYLNGLDCSNCAAKIEKEVGKLKGVTSSTIDFATKKLILQTKNSNEFKNIQTQAKRIIHRIEPKVEVVTEHHKKDSHEHNEHGHNTRITFTRLGVGAILTGIGMFAPVSELVELGLFIIAYLIVGGDIVLRAVKNIFHGQVFDEHFLMAIATIGAFAVGQYPEGVAVMLFYQIGELFQGMAVNRSRKSISALMDIRPDYANVKVGANTIKKSPDNVQMGDVIVIKPGEKVPLDGTVMEGSSMVDTSALTGESVPREVNVGSEILSGFINKNGLLTVQVTKSFQESTVSRILELVQTASSRKAPTENFITKFARYYTPVVVIIAVALAILPPLFVSTETFSEWIYRALVFLVISCPCALVVSIPLGFFGGIGAASKAGILVKGSNYLEALNDVKYAVFDKTGTLTKGVFKITNIHSVDTNSFSENDLLKYAAYAEAHSNHPIAQSIRETYVEEIEQQLIADYNEISGLGVQTVVDGKVVLAGNARLMKKEQISYDEPMTIGTVVHLAIDQQYAGYIVISDEVKEDSENAIQSLKKLGIKKTVMLTGDAQKVGQFISKQLGLDEVHAELLPQHKVEEIEKLYKQMLPKEKMFFVGDGMNDTPVLARADVGIAMGGLGSDAAIEAADIVIMTDELSKIPAAIQIAKWTRKIVWQNILFALGIKALFLLLGAFGIATMWEAVFSDVGVTLLAVFNAMRVMRVKGLIPD